MMIYVCGPYSADSVQEREQNLTRAMDVGLELIQRGHMVHVPHLGHYLDMRRGEVGRAALPWLYHMLADLRVLRVCQGLYWIGPSRGAHIERERAIELGLTIYTRMDEVPQVFAPWGKIP